MSKLLFKIKYPKFLLLLLTIVIAFLLFYYGRSYPVFHDFLVSLSYFGVFLSGFFYAYSFTATPATAVLLVLSRDVSVIIAGLLGGLGALLSDVIIFLFVRRSFNDEINSLKREKIIRLFNNRLNKFLGSFSKYLVPFIASFLIASPLPTEVGVALMSSLKRLSVKKFMIIAYLLHTLGIFIILLIGNAI